MNWFFAFFYLTVGQLIRLLYRVKATGLENVPANGALLCPNHASDLDPILIGMSLPVNYGLRIMGKAELFRNPVLGWILRHLGAFPVNRGGKDLQSVRTAMEVIRSGGNLLIFPEGTTIRNGVGRHDGLPAHAHPGIAMIALRTGATLIPVFADGPKKPFHRTRIIFGKPYIPPVTGRSATSEQLQDIATQVLREAYALGGQEIGGKRLCE